MGNLHSASHASLKPRKNVHWKSAGRPAVPGRPEIIPIASEDEPNAVTLRWAAAPHDGGATLLGYQVECSRVGSGEWLRTAPPLVARPELVLAGLPPPHRYQFRVAALNAVGRSAYSELSDVLAVAADRAPPAPPRFVRALRDTTALENDRTEFRVEFTGAPPPAVAWFKDDYEIFSSRRTAITGDEGSSVLVFRQTLASDEGEIKCTATNRAGHAVTRARLSLEAAPKLRYPRQYEDGLLYEVNETVFLKMALVGKPAPAVEWRHDGQPLRAGERVEVATTPKFAMLKIHAARRSDRGEYQVVARNSIGEDAAAFLVTVTAPPEPPRRVSVARQVDRSVTLAWDPPEDDGGCRVGNYVVEYYRTGWNVWLKATTSRKTGATLFDLIEGSEYRFRVKAESPYGMSAPSEQSAPVRVPGRAVDEAALAAEARIIRRQLEDAPEPRRQRPAAPAAPAPPPAPAADRERPRASSTPPGRADPNEFMLILYPDNKMADKTDISEKRSSFQLDLEEALSPPPLSLSAPELSALGVGGGGGGGGPLRHAVSSSELLHERAMARFYNAVALQERLQQAAAAPPARRADHIPRERAARRARPPSPPSPPSPPRTPDSFQRPDIFIKTDSVEGREYKYESRQASQDSEPSDHKWQHASFDEDYTASTVSTEEYSDEGSLDGEVDRNQHSNEQDTYNPRDKLVRPSSSLDEVLEEEESEREIVKPLPLPDPNFVPKPILKRRESNESSDKLATEKDKINSYDTHKTEVRPAQVEPPKKQEKMTLFKKFTKMPVQKPFPFPKILKKHSERPESDEKAVIDNKLDAALANATGKVETVDERISDEGRTVIDYYGGIVKEYGGQKRPTTPLYLNTEDLKTVAEKQALEKKQKLVEQKKIVRSKKPAGKINKGTTKTSLNNTKVPNSVDSQPKTKEVAAIRTKLEKKTKLNSNNVAQDTEPRASKKGAQQIVVTTGERATVVTIDYGRLEQRARAKVRSAIHYAVDSCLLALAFWVWLFRDERLALPLLALVGYRQLAGLPRWAAARAPAWLKRKPS